MSTQRRHLVQRNRNSEAPSASRSQHRGSEASARQPTALPPYEPPTCPLSEDARRKIENLRVESSSLKYKNHISVAIKALQNATPECHERVYGRREHLNRLAAKQKKQDNEGTEISKEYHDAEKYLSMLQRQVDKHTREAEKALRDLIDYGDELSMQDTIMKKIIEEITDSAVSQSYIRRRRRRDDDGEDYEEDASVDNVAGVSTVELLKNAKEEYASNYGAKTMRARYAENNEYKTFKQGIHEAANQGDNVPVMPHARTWFPEEKEEASGSGSRRRRNNAMDNRNSDEEGSDDEVQIAGVTQTYRCPLTLQIFREPYSNNVCNHTFEKEAIIEYINSQGTVFHPPQRNGEAKARGRKQANCPEAGCDKMLALDDFYDDVLLLRKLLRAQKNEAAQQDDDDSDDQAPRGTQRNRPEPIDEDGDEIDVDREDEAAKRAHAAKIKRERHQSRGLSVAPSHQASSEPEDMDMDDA